MGWVHLKIFSRTTRPILTRLGTNNPWRDRIQVFLKEGDSPLQGEIIAREKKYTEKIKILFLQNQQAKINQTWYMYKLSFGEKN
jgi:hypothetical protein